MFVARVAVWLEPGPSLHVVHRPQPVCRGQFAGLDFDVEEVVLVDRYFGAAFWYVVDVALGGRERAQQAFALLGCLSFVGKLNEGCLDLA
jgi:hypothetical protein